MTIAPDKKVYLRDEDTQRIYEKPAEVQRLGELKSTYLVHNPLGIAAGEDPGAGVRL